MQKQKYWCIIPAAGIGKRMGSEIPKQYLKLHGKPILYHSLNCLLSHPLIEKVVVSLAPNDEYWPLVITEIVDKENILIVAGGKERYHSVINALAALSDQAENDDWILVHDAVRPCLTHKDLNSLIEALHDHPIGGILGSLVRDTLKRTTENGDIINTIDRTNTWQAQTPQMFRYKALTEALQNAEKNNHPITDEASAFELLGAKPKIIEGHPNNIKITHPEDLAWVEHYFIESNNI